MRTTEAQATVSWAVHRPSPSDIHAYAERLSLLSSCSLFFPQEEWSSTTPLQKTDSRRRGIPPVRIVFYSPYYFFADFDAIIAQGGTLPSWQASYEKAARLVDRMTLVEKVNVTSGTGWQMGLCVGNTGAFNGVSLVKYSYNRRDTGPAMEVGFPSLCLQDGLYPAIPNTAISQVQMHSRSSWYTFCRPSDRISSRRHCRCDLES